MTLRIDERDGGVVWAVKVTPGSSRTAVAGLYGASLKVRVAAAPEKGRANQAVLALLAKVLRVGKSQLAIVSGTTSPHKEVFCRELTAAEVLARLAPYLK